ncbi:MAG: thioredoxin [Nitrospinae bacterium]|nr:thioredoxin [Nitrospinota bacterium]
MAGNMETFTDANFDEKVLKADKLTVVDFWAEWCAPCRMIAPTLAELAGEYTGKVVIGKVNVDENNKTATKYGIRSIPTLLFFRDGQIRKQVVGVRSKEELAEAIDENI